MANRRSPHYKVLTNLVMQWRVQRNVSSKESCTAQNVSKKTGCKLMQWKGICPKNLCINQQSNKQTHVLYSTLLKALVTTLLMLKKQEAYNMSNNTESTYNRCRLGLHNNGCNHQAQSSHNRNTGANYCNIHRGCGVKFKTHFEGNLSAAL